MTNISGKYGYLISTVFVVKKLQLSRPIRNVVGHIAFRIAPIKVK